MEFRANWKYVMIVRYLIKFNLDAPYIHNFYIFFIINEVFTTASK